MAKISGWGKADPDRKKAKPATKLSNAVAVPSAPASSGKNKTTESISIRPIENGYIIRKSISGPKTWEEREYYSAKKPDIEV